MWIGKYSVVLIVCLGMMSQHLSAATSSASRVHNNLGILTVQDTIAEQDAYVEELLQIALNQESFYENFTAKRGDTNRLDSNASETNQADIIWSPAHRLDVDSEHHVIKVPVFRGLLSYYSVIYHKPSVFDAAQNGFEGDEIGMLQHDVVARLLQTQGYKVVKTRAVGSLVHMLNKARFEAILAPTVEVSGLSVTQAYPTPQQITRLHNPWYFVVRKDKPELAKALEQGLHSMLKKGTLDSLMEKTPWMQNLKQHLTQQSSLSLDLRLADQHTLGSEAIELEAIDGFWVAISQSNSAANSLLSASF